MGEHGRRERGSKPRQKNTPGIVGGERGGKAESRREPHLLAGREWLKAEAGSCLIMEDRSKVKASTPERAARVRREVFIFFLFQEKRVRRGRGTSRRGT